MEVKAGDLLLTRNAGGEAANPVPGYYNHCAIIGPLDWVIEAQASMDSVIAVPIWYFFDRYPEVLVLRCINRDVVERTAELAPRFMGREYALYMTIRPLWRWNDKDSCISLIRRIYNIVCGSDYKWRVPDSLLEVDWLPRIALKSDYVTYKKPDNLFRGMVQAWPNRPAAEFYQAPEMSS